MSPAHQATLTFTYPSVEQAEIVERSVRQEQGEIEGDRTSARLRRAGDQVTVVVSADDLVALRAGCNTWASLIAVADRLVTPADP